MTEWLVTLFTFHPLSYIKFPCFFFPPLDFPLHFIGLFVYQNHFFFFFFNKEALLKHVYYLGWNRSPAQVRCMRQALGPGALGKPRGSGWRGRWEGGLGWGTHVNPWLFHFNVWQKSTTNKKKIKKKRGFMIYFIDPWGSDSSPITSHFKAFLPIFTFYFFKNSFKRML